MKKLFCSEHIADPNHNVLILARNGSYDCYVSEHDDNGHETPFFFMFGLPISENTHAEAVDIAIANVPDYGFLFDD